MRAAPIAFYALSLVALICRLHAQADIVQKTRLDPDYQQGKAALYAGRYAEAKHYFELAEIRVGSNSAELNAGLALAELQMGQYAEARQHEATVLRLVSDDHARAEAYNTIGSAWLREARQSGGTDQLRAAEESFREATKADPGFAAPYYDLGESLLHQNRGSEAANAFKDFVRVSADDPTLIRDMPVQRLGRAPDFRCSRHQRQNRLVCFAPWPCRFAGFLGDVVSAMPSCTAGDERVVSLLAFWPISNQPRRGLP